MKVDSFVCDHHSDSRLEVEVEIDTAKVADDLTRKGLCFNFNLM